MPPINSLAAIHDRINALKGLIFDKDGVLFPETPALIREYQLAAARALPHLDTRITEQHAIDSIAESYRRYGWSYELLRREYKLERADVHFTMHSLMSLDNIHRDPELPLAMKQASQRGLHFGVATHSNRVFTDRTIPYVGIKPYFSDHSIVTLEQNGFVEKSNSPSMVLEAAKRIGLPAHSCGFIENSSANLVPAKKAGFMTFLLTWGQDIHDYEPAHMPYIDMIFERPAQLLHYIAMKKGQSHAANDHNDSKACVYLPKHGLVKK